jgi:hypothetical protein
MANRKLPTIKGVNDDSLIVSIGALFRYENDSDWHINIGLKPAQFKKSVKISNANLLARRRTLNSTADELKASGYHLDIVLPSIEHWRSQQISTCPIPGVGVGQDSTQWCFVFENQGCTYFLPQFELARVLFFHHSYVTRLAMAGQGLAEEFDIQPVNQDDEVIINILPSCGLPKYLRSDYQYQRSLAWILLDPDVRLSFESIFKHQQLESRSLDKYCSWDFRFDPFQLEGTKLSINGHFDKTSQSFFIYEINSLKNIPNQCPRKVDFFDPLWKESVPRKGKGGYATSSPVGTDIDLDDIEDPGTDHGGRLIYVDPLILEYSNPFETCRIGMSYKSAAAGGKPSDNGLQGSGPMTASTNEPVITGSIASADFGSIEDQSDDVHLYEDRFKAFNSMVDVLTQFDGCRHVVGKLRKLPMLKGYKKHLKRDGSPRCLAYHLIWKNGAVYRLVEVDTSDDQPPLVTLLFNQQFTPVEWLDALEHLEIRLIKESLKWPYSYLNAQYGSNGYARIKHPDSSLDGGSAFDENAIRSWAQRVYTYMSE